MSEFILMLTRDDVTVANALDLADVALATDVKHVGFKDIGLARPQMQALVEKIHAAGRQAHLEVVSLSEADEMRSIGVACDIGVDYVIGGTHWRRAAERLAGSSIRYFPYAGQVIGHPAQLGGTADDIIDEAQRMAPAVDGINLLAFRHVGIDGAELLRSVHGAIALPVICAGSIDSIDRVRTVADMGVWGFTIGRAALDHEIVPGQDLRAQLAAVLDAARGGTSESLGHPAVERGASS